MLQVFPGVCGVDIFSKNITGTVVHEYSRIPNIEDFSFRLRTKGKVTSNPAVVCLHEVIHTYQIHQNHGLAHHQMDRLCPNESTYRVILNNADNSINPTCVDFEDKIFIYFVNTDGNLCELSHNALNGLEVNLRYIDQSKQKIHTLKAVKTDSGDCFVFYKKKDLCWINLAKSQNIVNQNLIKLPFAERRNHKIEVLQFQGAIYLYMVSEENDLYELVLDEQTETIREIRNIYKLNMLPLNAISMLFYRQEEKIDIYFAAPDQQIVHLSRKMSERQWSERNILILEPVGSFFTVKLIKGKIKAFFLDKNKILARFEIQLNGKCFEKEDYLPPLVWEEIKDTVKQVGGGYFSECYHYKEQNKAIKKFRRYEPEKIEEEIKNLIKLKSIYPDMVSHRLYVNGVLYGFTLPFLKGKIWSKLRNKNSDNLLQQSPIARVKLVIELAKEIRNLQSINLCHGDLHLQNILSNVVENGNILNPTVSARIIDFGNTFDMEPGVLVAQRGLTGSEHFLPEEVRHHQFNPYHINPYQLAYDSITILLFQQFNWRMNPKEEVNKLKEHKQYPQEIRQWICELIHPNITRKTKALFRDISHFQELTRKIYLQKVGNSIKRTNRVLKSVNKTNNTPNKVEKTVVKTPLTQKKKVKEVPRSKTQRKVERPKLALPAIPQKLPRALFY